jgi:GR25 family glycosyltransferase involved in LPS biosynthesis
MIPCHVIYLGDGFPNHQSLLDIGVDPIGFKGIDARKDEHLTYTDNINPICKHLCPKGKIGCALSHVLLAQQLYDSGVDAAIVLEDDAYPIVSDLNEEMKK